MSKKQFMSLLIILAMLFTSVLAACSDTAPKKADTSVETTTEITVEATTETSAETTTETSAEATTETSAEATTETSAETTTETSAETTTETSAETTTETSAETTTETSAEATTETSAETTTETSAEATTETSAEATTETSAEATTETSAEATTETSAEATTETSAEATTETSAEATTDTSAEATTETAVETTVEASTETTSETTEEETEMITDVMIGETIEAEYATDFTVSRVFSDDMVVQRGEHIRVWGFAPESENGKKVSGEFKGMVAEALIENGEWCLTFGARLEADKNGAEMKIYAREKEIVFSNVLVGDVYMVIGQSNVEAAVSNTSDIDPDAPIRLNRTSSSSGGSFPDKGTANVYKDLVNPKQWTKATASEVSPFSAIGYYFAKEIVERTDGEIPVGVIEIGFSGAPLGSFLPNEIAEEYKTDTLSVITGTYMTTGVNANRYPGRGIYNCHIAPFEKFAMAGLVWYQGESDYAITEAKRYNEVFSALITYMRSTHNLVNRDFPVFIMEFPSIYRAPADFSGTWNFMDLGGIRATMGSIPSMLKNSYTSVSSDLWADREYSNSLHPACKPAQADRLADLAEAVIYKTASLEESTGPVFKKAEIGADKKSVVITFTNVGSGLATKNGGADVSGIIGLTDKDFGNVAVKPTSAKITAKDQITVTFDTEIKSVGYNYMSEDFYGETINLCNSAGCPAAAFLSPYKDKEIGTFSSEDFLDKSSNTVKFKAQSIDTLTADTINVFEVGKVVTGLTASGNKIEITRGTAKIAITGWVGFGFETLMFGYSIDGGEAIFNTFPSTPGQAVINAGGQYAQRFGINANVSNLDSGEHTIDFLALICIKNNYFAVKFFSFTVVVTAPPTIPEGLDVPKYNATGYGFKKLAVDMFTKDGSYVYSNGGIASKLEADGNVVKVAKGTKTLRIYGWIGFETAIDKFGYALDGTATLETDPTPNPNQDIINSGGENARRYDVYADISGLDAGYHTFDLLVRINTSDGSTATLKILSFTLIIEE